LIHFYKSVFRFKNLTMAYALYSDSFQILCCGLKLSVRLRDKSKNVVKDIPAPVNKSEEGSQKTEVDNKTPQTEEEKGTSCCAISDCGSYLAVCDDRKQLTIWTLTKNEELVTLKNQYNLVRKASRVIFTPNSGYVLVADKNGDVYIFKIDSQESAENKSGKLLLGHLSMLLDILVSKDGKFVLTADRDEKIRVSRFPNSYNIHNFCLGHTEFVTSISWFPSTASKDLLVSGSGDGTVRVWDYLEGKTISSRSIVDDVEVAPNPDEEEAEDGSEKNGDDDMTPRVSPPSQPAVVCVQGLTENLVICQVERAKDLALYHLNHEHQLVLVDTLKLDGHLLSHYYHLPSLTLHLLFRQEDDTGIFTESFTVENKTLKRTNIDELSFMSEDFFSSLNNLSIRGPEGLHKRWFDNVKDYNERKEARILKNQNKQPPVKKLKT